VVSAHLDLSFLVLYLIFNILFRLWISRRKMAIGGSIIAANISTEHFIGVVGSAYASGFVLAQSEEAWTKADYRQ